jgi:hypothetical protein
VQVSRPFVAYVSWATLYVGAAVVTVVATIQAISTTINFVFYMHSAGRVNGGDCVVEVR